MSETQATYMAKSNRKSWFTRRKAGKGQNIQAAESKEAPQQSFVDRSRSLSEKINALPAEDLSTFVSGALSAIAKENEILQAVLFLATIEEDQTVLKYAGGYACSEEAKELKFNPGEGLPGQVYNDRKMLHLSEFPEGYIRVKTALGEASPKSLLILPLLSENDITGILELASFKVFNEHDIELLESATGLVAASIQAMKREQE